jgi:ADP-heptose:LPS heptosyltransferase
MRNILLLQLNRLGDLVQTVPLMRRFKEEDPSCRVTVACLEEFQAIIADSPYWDRVVPMRLAEVEALSDPEVQASFPNAPPFDRPEYRESYDLLVNLTSHLGSSILMEKMRATRKLGRVNTYAGELRLLGDWSKYLFAMVGHRADNLFNLVDVHMGMAGLEPRPCAASLTVPPARMAEARALLKSEGLRGQGRLVALQAGASDLNRAWSLENFARLASSLLADGNEVVLMGDPRERELTARLKQLAGGPLIDLAGKTALPLLPAVLKSCDLLVSNDTGTIHIAAGAGTPTLGLFFSTAYYSETAPYGAGHAVLQVEIPCSPCNASSRCPVQICREHLPVEAVHETVRWMLHPEADREPPPARPNLSLYRSRFLSGGSLLYFPVRPEAASSHYVAGLMGRLLWQNALELPPEEFLEQSWRRLRARGSWEDKRKQVEKVLETLEAPLRQGAETAADLRAVFAQPAPTRERVMELHGKLGELGAAFCDATQTGGLLGRFLQYEMMDLDYSPYPALAVELEAKYHGLSARAARLRSALSRLSA